MTDFNQRAKNLITAIAPDLFSEVIEKEYKGRTYVDFIIKNEDKELIMTTDYEEYSVFFTTFHTHFTPDTEDEEKEMLEEALAYIKEIITEKIIIASYYDRDNLSTCTYITPEEEPKRHEGKKLVLESWNDTYSQIFEAE